MEEREDSETQLSALVTGQSTRVIHAFHSVLPAAAKRNEGKKVLIFIFFFDCFHFSLGVSSVRAVGM